jgi:sortase A
MKSFTANRQKITAFVDPPLRGLVGATVGDVTAENGVRAPDAEPVKRATTKWEIVGVALTGLGVLLLLFLVYLYAFTPLTAVRDQHRLLQGLTGKPRAVFSLVNGHLPAQGRPVAVLDIPRLGEKEVVVNGTGAADLQEGPGLMANTALPGRPGNAVIAGRRVTYGAPFGRLASLVPGDTMHVVDGAGSFTFRVVRSSVVASGGRAHVARSGDAWLTLVTSNSSVRPSGQYAILARLVGRPALNGPTTEVGAPSVRLAFGGDPAAGLRAAAWAAGFLVLLAATLFSIRRWRQPWVTYLLAAPVLLALGLFTCGSLAQCLPATL